MDLSVLAQAETGTGISGALIAAFAALFGGVALKVTESFLNRNKVKSDVATEIRTELRNEVAALRAELQRVEGDLDKWKEKYYHLLGKFHDLRAGLVTSDEVIKQIQELEADSQQGLTPASS